MNDEKTKNLDLAISQIEKQYGKGSIMRLGNRDVLVPVSVIPTGSISIDAALGVGGFPRGRVIEVYGPESGGKTTLTLHVIAEAQKLGGQAAFIDAEHALDPVLRAQAGRGRGQSSGVAAGQRRTGARNRRSADPLQRGGHHRGGLGRRAGARAPNSKATWATRKWVCRRA